MRFFGNPKSSIGLNANCLIIGRVRSDPIRAIHELTPNWKDSPGFFGIQIRTVRDVEDAIHPESAIRQQRGQCPAAGFAVENRRSSACQSRWPMWRLQRCDIFPSAMVESGRAYPDAPENHQQCKNVATPGTPTFGQSPEIAIGEPKEGHDHSGREGEKRQRCAPKMVGRGKSKEDPSENVKADASKDGRRQRL